MRHDSNEARSSSKNSIGGSPPTQPNPYHLPLLEVVCGVNLIQLKRWYGRRVPHFRRLSLKSKVTQKLVNACRLTLQCPAAGEKKGVNGSQAGGENSAFIVFGAFSTSVGTAL